MGMLTTRQEQKGVVLLLKAAGAVLLIGVAALLLVFALPVVAVLAVLAGLVWGGIALHDQWVKRHPKPPVSAEAQAALRAEWARRHPESPERPQR